MSNPISSLPTDAEVAVPPAEPPAAPRLNLKLIGILSLSHLVVDLYQGSLPAILPFFKAAHSLTYAASAAIVLVSNLTSSVVQPVFGYLSDRRPIPWMIPVAIALTGFGLALSGTAPNYATLIALLSISGLGVAVFHPEGYKTATDHAGLRKASGIAWFSVGGNLGIALGPPLITLMVAGFGIRGTTGMLLPYLAVAGLVWLYLPHPASLPPPSVPQPVSTAGKSRPLAMILLIFIVAIRSWTQIGFTTFVPFFYVDHLKEDPLIVGPLLFVFLGAGALGTALGGPLADRWGTRQFILWGFLISTPLGGLFLISRGWVAMAVFGLFGAVLLSTFSLTVLLGQLYMPRRAGLASGLIVGFAIGAGGIGATILGWTADSYGLPVALWLTAAMPLAAFGAALLLPDPKRLP